MKHTSAPTSLSSPAARALAVLLLACSLPTAAIAGSPVQSARALLQQHGVPDAPFSAILSCIEQTVQDGLPPETLVARLREGLTKQADPAAIRAAVETHAAAMRQAFQLLHPYAANGRRPPPAIALFERLTRAIESGLPPDTFAGLFSEARNAGLQRLQSIVEAGEMLHLSGVDSHATGAFMRHCRERELRRMDTLRAARFYIERHAEGVGHSEILDRLHARPGEPPQRGRGQQRQRGR